jgi:hypothetical protein
MLEITGEKFGRVGEKRKFGRKVEYWENRGILGELQSVQFSCNKVGKIGRNSEKLNSFRDLLRICISLELFQGSFILLKKMISLERVQISQGTSRNKNSPMISKALGGFTDAGTLRLIENFQTHQKVFSGMSKNVKTP